MSFERKPQPDHEDAPHLQVMDAAHEEELAVEEAIVNSGMWFFWIAGFSIVNTILIMSGVDLAFLVGLGAGVILDVLAAEWGGMWLALSVAGNVMLAGFFAAMGFFAIRQWRWAFMLGMLAYVGDALVVLWLQDWKMLLFHGFVLYQLSSGLMACFAPSPPRLSRQPSSPCGNPDHRVAAG